MDRSGIASRIRGLLGGQNEGDLAQVARRLDVDEVSLRMSVDELSPYPTVDVLSAIVIAYGVDPKWLLTGVYSAASHRSVADAGQDSAAESLRAMIEHHGSQGELGSPAPLRLVRDA